MEWIDQLAAALPPALLYVVVSGVVVLSGIPALSVVVAAEPVLMLAALLATQGRVSVWGLCIVTITASVTGDILSYALGRQCAAWLPRMRLRRKHRIKFTAAFRKTRRRGLISVVTQRWIPPVRGLATAAMGADNIPFPRFVTMSVVASALWGCINVFAVYFGGSRVVLLVPLALAAVVVGRFVWGSWRQLSATPRD